jgi:hypothetical protein
MDRGMPLSAFEAYMWADDDPRHPMTALIEVEYSGRLRKPVFEAALSKTLQAHPLLRASIDASRRPPRWIVRESPSPFLCWDDESAPLRFPQNVEHIDLSREIGLRVWVRSGTKSGRIVLQLHHSCTDGVGVMSFLGDLLKSYAALACGDTRALSRDPRLLDSRERFHKRPRIGRAKSLWMAAKLAYSWRKFRPLALRDARIADEAENCPMESIRHRVLEPAELEGLLKVARASGVTLNDLLLRDLFLVLMADCEDRTIQPEECLCVCMPANLRDPADVAMPAANKMTMSFLRRTPDQCRDPERLLASIHDETTYIKRTRRGVSLVEVLRLALQLRGEIPQALLKHGNYATAVLSNLGRFAARDIGLATDNEGRLTAGDITVEQIVTAPNGRPGTAIVLVVLTYANRLAISLRFDSESLTGEFAEELLDAYVEQLHSTASIRDEVCV